ncbi:MAG: DUF1127 domain-containing protein [Pseudomonadota bacterium]
MAYSTSLSRPTALNGARAWGFVKTLNRLSDLARQRDALRKMDDTQMRDLGLNVRQIDTELRSSIWTRL